MIKKSTFVSLLITSLIFSFSGLSKPININESSSVHKENPFFFNSPLENYVSFRPGYDIDKEDTSFLRGVENCPSDIIQNTISGFCSTIVTWFPPTSSTLGAGMTPIEGPPPGSIFPIGTTTIKYEERWLVGGATTIPPTICEFTVTILETEDPTITCIGDQTKSADNGQCYYTVSGAEFDPITNDNCGIASVTNNINSGSTLNGEQIPNGTTINWTVVDTSGNTATCSFTVTVEDNEDPTASNPAPINVQCAGDVPTPDVTVVTDETDNCSGTITVAHVSDVSDGGSNPEVITRTYSVTDAAGNAINVEQTITINDTTNPTASNPAPINVQCAGDVPTPDVTVVTDETDNCSGTITVAHVSDVSDGGSNPEVITRTYSVTDAAGNAINVEQTITINDTTNPTASNPAPINVQCAGDVPTPDVTVVTDETDNCSGTITVAHVS
ncbi:HYR domain-containing protein, partial [Oceanihabitans sediminis]